MRALKMAAVLLGLVAVLVVGLVLARLNDMVQQEKVVLERSNILVSKTLGVSPGPRFLSQTIESGPRPTVWMVSGELALADSTGEEIEDWYIAVIKRVCDSPRDEKCWRLQSLTLGSKPLQTLTARVSPGDQPVPETAMDPRPAANQEEAKPPEGVEESQTSVTETAQRAALDATQSTHSPTELILLIQYRLNKLGYGSPNLLTLDGTLGPNTREAILAYQSANDLEADGEPSEALLRHLETNIGESERSQSQNEP